jgi:uncharacterized phage protein gp47/JayE
MAGLTANGFVKKTLDEIKTDLENSFRTLFGPFVNLLPSSVFATLIGIFSERIAEVWDVAEEVYNSQYPDTAEGVSLDNIGAYNLIDRIEEEFSTVEGFLLFGDAGTIVPVTTQFSVQNNPDNIFQPDEQVTLGEGVNAVQKLQAAGSVDGGSFALSYKGEVTEPLSHDATASDIADALNELDGLSGVEVASGSLSGGFDITFGGDDGLQEQPLLEVVSSLTNSGDPVEASVTEVTPGEPQAVVNLTAIEAGAKAAAAGTLTVIDTPVSGLERVTNPLDAELGRAEETDADYRVRRAASLTIAGSASTDAIRAKLLNLPGVLAAIVLENDSSSADEDGRPPNCIEAIVDGGESETIAETIWKSKAGGIQTYGNTSDTVVDSLGVTRTVYYSEAIQKPVYVSLDLTVDETVFPDDGVDAVKEAILDFGETLTIGEDVIVYPKFVSVLNDIDGILDVAIRIGLAPVNTSPGDPAVDANLAIAFDEKATFSNANLSVNVLP